MTFNELDSYIMLKQGATYDNPCCYYLETAKELIDHSYELVYESLTKKKREALES